MRCSCEGNVIATRSSDLVRVKVESECVFGILGAGGAILVTGQARDGASALRIEHDDINAGFNCVSVCVGSAQQTIKSLIGTCTLESMAYRVDSATSTMKCARNPVSSSSRHANFARSQLRCATGTMSSTRGWVSYPAWQVTCEVEYTPVSALHDHLCGKSCRLGEWYGDVRP